jgi:hypothetical protein
MRMLQYGSSSKISLQFPCLGDRPSVSEVPGFKGDDLRNDEEVIESPHMMGRIFDGLLIKSKKSLSGK